VTLRYWDSCAFIGLLKAEVDKLEVCREIVHQAARGESRIVTSALTFIEVVHLGNRLEITAEAEEKLTGFFEQEYLSVINVDRRVGELARRLLWRYEDLKYKDAIHVATAVHRQVPLLETYDPYMLQLDDQVQLPGRQKLAVRRPEVEQRRLFPSD
jgi:predicted nucleic acid-binding protein